MPRVPWPSLASPMPVILGLDFPPSPRAYGQHRVVRVGPVSSPGSVNHDALKGSAFFDSTLLEQLAHPSRDFEVRLATLQTIVGSVGLTFFHLLPAIAPSTNNSCIGVTGEAIPCFAGSSKGHLFDKEVEADETQNTPLSIWRFLGDLGRALRKAALA